jgi:hypothetical protein
MKNEYLDNLVRHFADCVDHRFQRISRRRRTDPSVTAIRGDRFDFAFCHGAKHGLKGAGQVDHRLRGLFKHSPRSAIWQGYLRTVR